MGILVWVGAGAITGIIARILLPKETPGTLIVPVLLGVTGGLSGGWLGATIWGAPGALQIDYAGIPLSFAGAVIMILAYHFLIGRREIKRLREYRQTHETHWRRAA